MHIESWLRARYLLVLMLVLTHAGVMAQVKFSTIPSTTKMGKADYLQIEYVVENAREIESISQPEFRDFQIIQGPNQSTGMTMVNGAVSQYKALSFVLQPLKTGSFTIPGATALVDGKKMQSNPVTIQVEPGGTGAGPNRAMPMPMPMPMGGWPGGDQEFTRDYILRPGEDLNEKIRKNLFVRVQLSKTSCYVGEPIVATYKLYSRLQSESRVTRHPSLNGFSVYDMVDPTADNSSIEKINGKPFSVHIIRKAQLIPLQAGKIVLDPVELDNTVHFIRSTGKHPPRSSNPIQELFDRLAGADEESGERVEEHVTVESKPAEVEVRELPLENRPADFTGAVGKFTLEAAVDKKTLALDDAGLLKLTVKGTGNLPMVNAPAVSWPAGCETYAGNTRESIDKTVAPMNGNKTFEFKFIPGKAGSFTIPAVSFSYFDPADAHYKTVSSQPLTLDATPALARAPAPHREEAPADSSMGARQFFTDHLEWIFALFILASLAAYFYVQNRRARKQEEKAKRAAAAAAAALASQEITFEPRPDPLANCRFLLQSGDYRGFYSALNRAIWNELAAKLGIRSSDLNKQHILDALREKGWAETDSVLLRQVLSECEVKLYTPDHNAYDSQRILQNAEYLLAQLDRIPAADRI